MIKPTKKVPPLSYWGILIEEYFNNGTSDWILGGSHATLSYILIFL